MSLTSGDFLGSPIVVEDPTDMRIMSHRHRASKNPWKSIFEDQAEFMRLGGQTVGEMNPEQARLYVRLINEEVQELMEAVESNNDVEIIKELMDCIVVLAGLANSLTSRPKKAWDLVHESNMAKVSGAVEKRADGKILKSEEYKKTLKAKLNQDLRRLIDGY